MSESLDASIRSRPNIAQSVALIAADIKLAHSVFALPFAVLAAFMAWQRLSHGHTQYVVFVQKVGLIVLAMFLARTVAMLANRWLDREIDKHNPRTAQRALASGQLSPTAAILTIAACAIAFIITCAAFGVFFKNWWPLVLSIPVLAWISAYGYFKRITALCHLYLGSSLALSPIAAAIAMGPASVLPGSHAFQPSIWLLSGMVFCWVAGFDIIYALQDVEVDREQGLHSMPSRLGVPKALLISRVLHVIAVACLIGALVVDERLHIFFGIGVAIVAALLLYEHLTVARWGTTRIALAFFTLNGIISCLLGALGIIDLMGWMRGY
jgi:4-hydroxybenzoate polyprenyltransferase